MSLTTFGVIGASQEDGFFAFPQSSGGPAMVVGDMPALQDLPVTGLRELTFPAQGDPLDVFSLTIADGSGWIDQGTGRSMDFTANTLAQDLYQLAFTLHAGQGSWAYALFLGLSGLAVPVLFVSGLASWTVRVRGGTRIAGNDPAGHADTVILVGSEGNSTWGFARSLHASLKAEGLCVHTAAMNDLARNYPKARWLIVLAATYGDGDAPVSATGFQSRLANFEAGPALGFSVVGFGDRGFAAYCAYAGQVERDLKARGLRPLLEMATVDRQSAQDFAAWSRAFGAVAGIDLEVEHRTELPELTTWECLGRKDYGQAYQTPKSVLRFRPAAGGRGSGKFRNTRQAI